MAAKARSLHFTAPATSLMYGSQPGPIAVTQRLLEHSSPNLINKIYTNVDPVLRNAIDNLPINDWL